MPSSKKKSKRKTIILLNGWGQSTAMWDAVMDELDKDYEIVRLNWSGFFKPNPNYKISLNLYRDLVQKAILEIDDSDKVFVIAHSFAGRVLGSIDDEVRNKIDSVIFLSTNLQGGVGIKPRIFKLFSVFPQLFNFISTQLFHPLTYKNVKPNYNYLTCRNLLRTYLEYSKTYISNTDLSKFKNKVFMHGERDWIVRPKNSIQVASATKSKYYLFKGAGHFPHIHSKQKFLKLIKTLFL